MGRKKKYLTEEERVLSNRIRAIQWVKDNKERAKLTQEEYRKNNYIKEIERHTKYRKENSESIKERQKIYRIANPEKINERQKIYRKNNPHTKAWRGLLKSTFKRFNKEKEGHTIDLLGYSAEELKNHITNLFTEGMSWDNHGEWHIDHIKPVSSFDKETPMNIVNALNNLQPLWATTREINGVIYIGNLNKSWNPIDK